MSVYQKLCPICERQLKPYDRSNAAFGILAPVKLGKGFEFQDTIPVEPWVCMTVGCGFVALFVTLATRRSLR